MIFLHGFKSFWPNSCCKLFIYVLGKRKIYVGHQDPTERFFLARNDNWLRLKCIISHIFFFDVFCTRFYVFEIFFFVQKLGIAPLHRAGPARSDELSLVFHKSKQVLQIHENVCKNASTYSFPSQPALLLK